MLKAVADSKEEIIQDGILFHFIGNDNWAKWKNKDGSTPHGKFFVYRKCKCGRLISNCGFAQQHKCKA